MVAISFLLAGLLPATGSPLFNVSANPRVSGTSPVLGAVASYSVLAGSIVTNNSLTTVSGDLGVSPSIGVPPHVTGFPPGVVGPPGVIHDADAHAAAAQAANIIAFGALDQSCDVTYPGVQNLTLTSPLVPGVYCAGSFTLSGNLTLHGHGDRNRHANTHTNSIGCANRRFFCQPIRRPSCAAVDHAVRERYTGLSHLSCTDGARHVGGSFAQ